MLVVLMFDFGLFGLFVLMICSVCCINWFSCLGIWFVLLVVGACLLLATACCFAGFGFVFSFRVCVPMVCCFSFGVFVDFCVLWVCAFGVFGVFTVLAE